MELLVMLMWVVLIMVHCKSFLSFIICSEMFMLVIYTFGVLLGGGAMNCFSGLLMIILLAVAVCEAVLGLALLVNSCRVASYYSSHPFSVLKF